MRIDESKTIAEVLNQVSKDETVIVTEKGEDRAALVPIELYRLLEKLIEMREDQIDIAEAEKILNSSKPEDWIAWEITEK